MIQMIIIDDLEKKTKENGSQESIAPLFKNQDCQIWIGIRIRKKNLAEVFTAASIRLGFLEDCTVDIERLTEAVGVLRKLNEQGYCLYYCGNGSMYVERESSKKHAKKHIEELLTLLAIDTASVEIIGIWKKD